jgi:hypothetical protein
MTSRLRPNSRVAHYMGLIEMESEMLNQTGVGLIKIGAGRKCCVSKTPFRQGQTR